MILGAREKAERLQGTGDAAERNRALLEELLVLPADDSVDAEAALTLHESGWTRAR